MKEMDGQKNTQVKQLMRTQSSLLRSSPTLRSSIPSLSSFTEDDVIAAQADVPDVEEEDNNQKTKKPNRSGSTPRTGSTHFASDVIVLISLACFTLFSIFFFSFFFFFTRKEETPTSENLLLALIFIAITLFFANKNKNLINKTLSLIKNRFGFSKSNTKPVQWFIGNSSSEKIPKGSQRAAEAKRVVREGVEFYSNGDYYEGEFYNGKCSGSGVYNYFVKGRYEGDWIDGAYDGHGIESWARGSKYRGQYRQGLRHGYGVYRFYTGDCYAGEWFNGQSHGVGVQTCSDNSCYVGEFKFGVKHGLGCYHFRNGDRYAGEYFNDKIHGFGVYHFANGHCYEGSWHEGRKQGYGMYTFRNGEGRCGEWDAGKLIHPQHPLTDSVLRAVQAARKTAENAVNLRRVDEQLKKAVAVANRAAAAARVAAVKAVQNRMSGKFYEDVV